MSDIVREQGPSRALGRLSSMSAVLSDALNGVGPPLLFAFRLWASVCLALYVAFWLELDNPFWAGTSAAIVCQPQLGASLRKGWFRMIGTLVGATMIVVLTGCFPQDRIAFLGLLALWGALCAFGATVFRNFASYSAALAGYTAAHHCRRNTGCDGRPQFRSLYGGGHPGERDLHRDRLCRHRSRRDRSWGRAAPACFDAR